MGEAILRGTGSSIVEMPRAEWEEVLAGVPSEMRHTLGFMSRRHHLARYFVVREILRTGQPVSPARIEQAVRLEKQDVVEILEDLERNLFFLRRDSKGNVEWAYPVTAAHTPHRLKFSTGEEVYAA